MFRNAHVSFQVDGYDVNVHVDSPRRSTANEGSFPSPSAMPPDMPSPMVAEGAGPQVSGKLGDGTLLQKLIDNAPALIALLKMFIK